MSGKPLRGQNRDRLQASSYGVLEVSDYVGACLQAICGCRPLPIRLLAFVGPWLQAMSGKPLREQNRDRLQASSYGGLEVTDYVGACLPVICGCRPLPIRLLAFVGACLPAMSGKPLRGQNRDRLQASSYGVLEVADYVGACLQAKGAYQLALPAGWLLHNRNKQA